MCGADLLHRRPAVQQVQRRLLAAIDRVADTESTHAVVVLGFHFDEDLVDQGDLDVAAGIREANDRGLILQRGDHVLRRGPVPTALVVHQLDAVVRVAADPVGRRQSPVSRTEVDRFLAFDQKPSLRHLEDRQNAEENPRTLEYGNVSSVLDRPVGQTAEVGELVLQVDLLHVRQILDPDAVDRGTHPRGVDVVVRVRAQVQGDEVVGSPHITDHQVAVHVDLGAHPVHRPLPPFVLRVAARVQRPKRDLDAVRIETEDGRADQLVRSASHRHVAGSHPQLVGIVRRGRLPGREQQHRTVLQKGRTEQDRGHAGARHARQGDGETAQRSALDPGGEAAVLAAFDRFFENPPLELGRHALGIADRTLLHRSKFDRAQYRGLESRLVLFDVQRHLLPGHPLSQGYDEQPNGKRDQGHVGQPAEDPDRSFAVEEVVHAPYRHGEGGESGHCQHDEAAQCDLRAPPRPHAPDDAHQLAVCRVVDGIETGCHHVSSPVGLHAVTTGAAVARRLRLPNTPSATRIAAAAAIRYHHRRCRCSCSSAVTGVARDAAASSA